MRIISLHLRGKMAHFRKFYSNSSSLSYLIPPRTTITGILAGLLGYKKDSYYELFSLNNCNIALSIGLPMKKIIQKVNYLMIKTSNDFNGSKPNHSQTALELVIPKDIKRQYLDYTIYINHIDKDIMNNLEKIAVESNSTYMSKGIAFALGTAFNLGWIEYGGIYEGEDIENFSGNIDSVINLNNIKNILIDNTSSISVIKEEIPIEFDKNRCITSRGIQKVIIELSGKSLPAQVNKAIRLNDGKVITWI